MKHVPVLLGEVLECFNPSSGDILIDATLGNGGHAKAYLEAAGPAGRVIGLDADPMAIKQARAELAPYGNRVTYINDNFSNLINVLKPVKDSTGGGIVNPSKYTHILFDLGIGSHQLADDSRGFSFRGTGPLTMRYGQSKNLPAAQIQSLNWITTRLGHYPDVKDIIQLLKESQLAEVIKTYGEERYANRIARTLKKGAPPLAANELAAIISGALPKHYARGRLHPATRTFQALRLATNRELEALRSALPQAAQLLAPGGVIAIISFHSLEDRIAKNFLRSSNNLATLTKKPIVAGGARTPI